MPYILTQRMRHTVGVGPHAVTTTALMASSSVVGTAGAGAITFLGHATPPGGVAAPAAFDAIAFVADAIPTSEMAAAVGMEAVTVTTE